METFWKGRDNELVEAPDSPSWKGSSNGIECTRRYKGKFALCRLWAPIVGSTVATGEMAGLKVADWQVEKEPKGGIGVLTIKFTGSLVNMTDGEPADGTPQDQKLPDEECDIDFEEQQIALEKYPDYAVLGDSMLSAVRAYVDAENPVKREEFATKVETDILADELASKLLRGNTHYVLYVPVYKWVTSSWTMPQVISEGGYRETPSGPIPPPDWDWLRRGDQVRWTGQNWQLTRTWIGAETWDSDIYGLPL